MRRTIRWLTLGIVVAAAAWALPTSVSGHSEYESSTPARDEVVQTAPAQVDVFFSQEVFRQEGANYVRVFNDAGDQVSGGDGTIDDDDRTHIVAEMPAEVAPGRYIVQWQTLSDLDGDDDSGAFCFYVQTEPTQAQRDECAAFAEGEDATPQATSGATADQPTAVSTEPVQVTPEPTASTGDDDDGVSSGTIVGGIVAAVIIVIVVGGGAAIWLRRTLE